MAKWRNLNAGKTTSDSVSFVVKLAFYIEM